MFKLSLTLEEAQDLVIGTKVRYGLYEQLTFEGFVANECVTNECVRLKDKSGRTMDIFTSLFLTHGSLYEE